MRRSLTAYPSSERPTFRYAVAPGLDEQFIPHAWLFGVVHHCQILPKAATMTRRRLSLAALVLASCISTSLSAAPIARLTLQSDVGDYIGAGQSFDIVYTPQTSTFFSANVRRTIGGPPGQPAEVDFALGTTSSGADNTFALVFFGTDQLGIPLAPGTYPNVQRADFAAPGYAGLDVSFQNRGCNTITGSFVITQAVFGADSIGNPTIQRLAATFVQHCEGAEPALRGTFYFDATGVLPPLTTASAIPALSPVGQAGIAMLVALVGALLLRRSSFS